MAPLIESDREMAEMLNNYDSAFASNSFALPNMEELAKPTNLISDISLSYENVCQLAGYLVATL